VQQDAKTPATTADARDKPKQLGDYYNAWRMDPSPTNLAQVVKALEPVVSYKVSAMGVADNPQMKHQARLFAVDAVKSFNPGAGASLTTWTQSQLQGMNRFRRENSGPVKVPDRLALDAWAVEKARRELEDEFGYEPDVKTLADRAKLSVKRIAAVNKATRPIASDSQMHDPAASMSDFMGEALEYVYDESDPIDRKIIEMSTGYGGVQALPKNKIAERLGVSSSQITRRTERIAQKLQAMERDIEETYV
jgi:hypothetical protein